VLEFKDLVKSKLEDLDPKQISHLIRVIRKLGMNDRELDLQLLNYLAVNMDRIDTKNLIVGLNLIGGKGTASGFTRFDKLGKKVQALRTEMFHDPIFLHNLS